MSSQQQEVSPRQVLLSTRRILVVEDDAVTRFALCQALVDAIGYSALSAKSGEQALELMQAEKIDAVFTDTNIERGMDGDELIRQMRLRGINIPVCLMSADDDNESIAKSLRVSYLKKPFSIDKFEAVLAQLISAAKAAEA